MKYSFFLLLILSLRCSAQQNDQQIIDKANSLIVDANKNGMFSGVAVISINGKKIFSKEIGYADLQTKELNEKTTLFNIGSLNKKFTQEIINQLVSEKKLSYDDKLSEYLDLKPADKENKITIQHLLDMKSGLGDFLQSPLYIEKLQFQNFTLAELIDMIKNEPLQFEPGSNRKYSNSGYAVLGALIEKITGKSYEQNLKERIANPLGLDQIFYTKEKISGQPNKAIGIDKKANSINEVIANSTPAGGLYTNIDNLLHFVEAKLLPQDNISGQQGPPLFAGGSPNWSAAVSYDKKLGLAIVVMANIGNDISVEIVKRLNSIVRYQPYPPLKIAEALPLENIINERGYDYIKTNLKTIVEEKRIPYDDHFLNDAALIYIENNKPEIAINLFKLNVELFPNSPFTYDMLAQTYLKAGDKANALTNFKKVVELDPRNENVKRIISELERKK